MFKLIKLAIALGLIIGVILLGVKIQKKSSEMELDMAEKKSAVQEKIAALKKEALKKTLALGKIEKGVNDSLTQKPAVPLNPLDEEDRKLTTEILAEAEQNRQPSTKAMNIPRMYSEASIAGGIVSEKEPAKPLDMNRITEIRDIYSKAVETLDLR